MHIPDGFLDARTSITAGALAAAGLGYSLRHCRKALPPRKVPLLGLAAAFVFAAQMLNFPVAGGTSGHLIGGVLAAALLGPAAAVVVITAVLIVQCLMFADGGITALGANIFNMAILGGAVGGLLYQMAAKAADAVPGKTGRLTLRLVGAAMASWLAIELAAIAAAGELATSGAVAWNVALPAMAGWHALIGIGEGAITVLVLSAVAAARPELVLQSQTATGATGEARAGKTFAQPFLIFGLLASIGIALFVSPFASELPDGLTYVAEKLGFADREQGHPALFDGYTPLFAAAGCLVLFAATWAVGKMVAQPKANSGS